MKGFRLDSFAALAAALFVVGLRAADTPPLVEAVQRRDAAAWRPLLVPGADLRAADADGNTALHWAALHHDRDAVAAELRHHAWRSGLDPADVVVDRFLHRLVVAHGAPSADGGGLAGRPTIDALGIPRVRIAGDWVGPEGLLADAAVASGVAAAESVLGATRARIPA